MVDVSPTQGAVVVALLVTLGVIWYIDGRGKWRQNATTRLIYGLPLGTIMTTGIVIGVYLLLQGGLQHWAEPLVLPFVSWSYFYPLGTLAAGVTHGSPSHLISNLTATLAFAPLAEYAWSHYPPGKQEDDTASTGRSLIQSPWIRALGIFPAALLGAALITSLASLGPGLGFSGAVFAIAGFALVWYPVPTVLAAVGAAAAGTVYQALIEPVARGTIEAGAPAPPSWAGIGFHAHALGFLLGVLCGALLLVLRHRRPQPAKIALATLVLGLIQGLWLIVWTEGADEFILYRGVGVVVLTGATLVVTAAAAGTDRPIPRPLSVLPWAPTRRQLALGWLVIGVGLWTISGIAGAAVGETPMGATIAMTVIGAVLLALPALPPLIPDRWLASPLSQRQGAIGLLALTTVIIALPGVLYGLTVVDGTITENTTISDEGVMTVEDYTVTYVADATSQQRLAVDLGGEAPEQATYTGVIVTSDQRELWTIGTREEQLAYHGNETLLVGGVGWRQSIDVERTGWDVVGNGSAYAVDLINTTEGQETQMRSFASDPVQATGRINGTAVEVVPTMADMHIRAIGPEGTVLDTAPLPAVNATTTVGPIAISHERTGNTSRLMASSSKTTTLIAEKEQYVE